MTDAPSSPLNTPSLTQRVARGAAWIMGAGIVARLLGALNTVVIARLLAPDDIGVVATAAVAMQLLQGISDFGVSQAFSRCDARRPEHAVYVVGLARCADRGCVAGFRPFRSGFLRRSAPLLGVRGDRALSGRHRFYQPAIL